MDIAAALPLSLMRLQYPCMALPCGQKVKGEAHLRKLLLLEVLCDVWVEVLGVALIQTVNLPLLLHLDVTVYQDEFPNGLQGHQGKTS